MRTFFFLLQSTSVATLDWEHCHSAQHLWKFQHLGRWAYSRSRSMSIRQPCWDNAKMTSLDGIPSLRSCMANVGIPFGWSHFFFFFQFPDLAYIATTKWYWQHGYLALENIVNKLSFPLPSIHHGWITLTQTVKPFMHGNFIKQSIVFPSPFEAKLDDLWNWRCLQSV